MSVSNCELILFHKFLPAAIGRGIHALNVHRLKACLITAVPSVQSAALLSDLTQPAAGNGYVSGGVICAVSEPAEYVGGEYYLSVTYAPSFTATGTGYSFLGLGLYNDTAPSKNLIATAFTSTGGQVAITHVAQSGLVVTLTKAAHGLSNGDKIVTDRLPFAWMNGTFTVANVTTDTFDIPVTMAATLATQAVASGKLIKPETITLAGGGTHTVSFDPSGVFIIRRL
jgi:hypothetical protein